MKQPRKNRSTLQRVAGFLGAALSVAMVTTGLAPAAQAADAISVEVAVADAVESQITAAGSPIHNFYVPTRQPSAARGTVNQLTWGTTTRPGTETALPGQIQGGNIYHAWNMPFNEIRHRLPQIAAAGFGTIQTSPIGESVHRFSPNDPAVRHLSGYIGTWWMLYQPTSFTIGNMLGTEDEFRALTREAAEHGIHIIVDAIPNHLTTWWNAIDNNLRHPWITWDGGIPGSGTWYDNNINNWDNRHNTTRRRLVGLLDLNTPSQRVQQEYFDFLGRIIDAGATGFRYDAVAHIELPCGPTGFHDTPDICSDFFPNMLDFVQQRTQAAHGVEAFQYGEILHRWHYRYLNVLPNMALTADPYGYSVRNYIRNNHVQGWDASWHGSPAVPNRLSNMMVPWVESHDNFGNQGISRNLNYDQIRAGWALITARAETSPLFLVRPEHSFVNNGQMFSPNADGSFRNNWGHSNFATSDRGTIAVNWFANHFHGMPERTSTHANNTVAMIERGWTPQQTHGVTIVNVGTNAVNVDFPVAMMDGVYTDQVTGAQFTVANGRLTGPAIGARNIAVIHNFEHPAPRPAVDATPGTSNFMDYRGILVTKTFQHADSATYAVYRNGELISPAAPFVSGAQVRIGVDAEIDDVFTLVLTATDGVETTTAEFNYTKLDPLASIRVEFTHPTWTNVNIHAWHTGSHSNVTGAWPGQPMAREIIDGQVVWTFTFDPEVNGPINLIFNNGASQTGQVTINSSSRVAQGATGQPGVTDIVPPRHPAVFAQYETANIFTPAGIDVTLIARNTTSSYYRINDGDPVAFESGDVITVGAGLAIGERVTLTVSGTDGEHTNTRTFEFVRLDPAAAIRVEFVHPNWTNVNIHAWHHGGSNVTGDWPGIAMTREVVDGQQVWVHTFAPDVAAPLRIIFNNGSHQTDQFEIRGSSRITPQGIIEIDPPAVTSRLWAEFDSATFTGAAGVQIQLFAQGMASANQRVEGMPAPNTFTSGATITAFADLAVGQTRYLELSGYTLAGEFITARYEFTRVAGPGDEQPGDEPGDSIGLRVEFVHPTWPQVRIHAWNNAQVGFTGPWPGQLMSQEVIDGENVWVFEFSAADIARLGYPNIVFNNGNSGWGNQTADILNVTTDSRFTYPSLVPAPIPTPELPGDDDPIEDDPIVDDPIEDDPIEDDPIVDDPIEDDPIEDDPIEDDPIVDDPIVDDPADDAPDYDYGYVGDLDVFMPELPYLPQGAERGFYDVASDHHFANYIGWLTYHRIANGWDAEGTQTLPTFRPGLAISRQAMAAFLFRAAGSPAFDEPTEASFVDVPTNHPFFTEIEWLATTGITTGWADGTFRPGNDITRESMAAFLYRFHGRPELGDLSGYGFVDTASSPFANYISWLASTGITTGWADGTFRPGNTVTREAMAAFLHRAYAGAAAQAFDAGLWHIGALATEVAG